MPPMPPDSDNPASPRVSYICRFCGSERTSYLSAQAMLAFSLRTYEVPVHELKQCSDLPSVNTTQCIGTTQAPITKNVAPNAHTAVANGSPPSGAYSTRQDRHLQSEYSRVCYLLEQLRVTTLVWVQS